ncbi:MAG: TA system VapC family ribonuclease toxin [Longimicrobiales bacterium]
MLALLDVNVLVALAWPNHIHHARARAWFGDHREDGWATCSITQGGFVRVSSNRTVIPEARSPAEAIALLRQIVGLPGHVFLTDHVPLTTDEVVDPMRIVSYRQVTDAHLLTLAVCCESRLATFDRGIPELLPAKADRSQSVVLIP